MTHSHTGCGDDPGNIVVFLAPSDPGTEGLWSAVCKRCATGWGSDDDEVPDHVHEAVRVGREMTDTPASAEQDTERDARPERRCEDCRLPAHQATRARCPNGAGSAWCLAAGWLP
jgi:protein-arginine kinase activator protein McsA